ncbi:nuclear transport factor 2 family protein [Methylobacterium sp. 285MFTsu5.1]|uniref:nuclear transport factor 2 family protein n=1 Tax=Methylobacterium sp. 285MFTsu5.1 TaxID=1172187 RepID=UPI0009DC4A7A|nr:nuclear transport factor 2 family protein [Methylobacterium sp. 285MFTsu5.1]
MISAFDEVSNLIYSYLNNVDTRNHSAQIRLFTDDAAIRVLASNNKFEKVLHGPVIGGQAFAEASAALRDPMSDNHRTRHMTTDRFVAFHDGIITVRAQFIVVHTDRTDYRAFKSQIDESGAYQFNFRRDDAVWKICLLDIFIDKPGLQCSE